MFRNSLRPIVFGSIWSARVLSCIGFGGRQPWRSICVSSRSWTRSWLSPPLVQLSTSSYHQRVRAQACARRWCQQRSPRLCRLGPSQSKCHQSLCRRRCKVWWSGRRDSRTELAPATHTVARSPPTVATWWSVIAPTTSRMKEAAMWELASIGLGSSPGPYWSRRCQRRVRSNGATGMIMASAVTM